MDKAETKRFRANLDDELNGAILYDALAEVEKDPRLAEIYRRFAATERRHAAAWAEKLAAAGVAVPPFRPSLRTRLLSGLGRKFGIKLVLPTIVGMEQGGSGRYRQQADAAGMAGDEASHARLLRQISEGSSAGMQGGVLARIEGRHRGGGGNALRAAVLGANDGLVSNLSLVMGVAGAELHSDTILITGLAGLLAGACSMALGEWLSVQSSRELYQRQINIEKQEIADAPQEEAEELALIYQARGLPEVQARQLADRIFENHESALETLTREELGIDPDELGGSAWEAAITSFFLFAIGAIIPVIPFTFLHGTQAVTWSAAFSTVGLFAIGTAITLFTGRAWYRAGLRQVVFGLCAAALTFGIGRLIGVSLAG